MSQIHPDPDDALQMIATCTENRHKTWNKGVCSVTVIASTFPLVPKVATGWVWGAWAHGPTLVGVKSTFYLHCLCVWVIPVDSQFEIQATERHSVLAFHNAFCYWPFTMTIWLFVYNYIILYMYLLLRWGCGSRSIYAYGSLLAELVRNLKDGLKFLNHLRTWSVENG